MTCDSSNRTSQKNKRCSEGFNAHLLDFSGNRWEIFHLLSKARHVTLQIDCNGKSSPVLKVKHTFIGCLRV